MICQERTHRVTGVEDWAGCWPSSPVPDHSELLAGSWEGAHPSPRPPCTPHSRLAPCWLPSILLPADLLILSPVLLPHRATCVPLTASHLCHPVQCISHLSFRGAVLNANLTVTLLAEICHSLRPFLTPPAHLASPLHDVTSSLRRAAWAEAERQGRVAHAGIRRLFGGRQAGEGLWQGGR